MSSKAKLKEARDFLAKKDFKSALSCCKVVLNVDKKNYLALIICGKALAGQDRIYQAIQAYHKAAEINPQEITAWLGLAAIYENLSIGNLDISKLSSENENTLDLATIRIKLIECYQAQLRYFKSVKDIAKCVNITSKLVTQYENAKDIKSAILSLQDQISLPENTDENLIDARAALIKLLNSLPALDQTSDNDKLLRDTLEAQLTKANTVQNYDNFVILLRLLHRTNSFSELFQKTFEMQQIFPESVYASDWINKIYLEFSVDMVTHFITDLNVFNNIEVYVDGLLLQNPDSYATKLSKAAILWKKLKYAEVILVLQPILECDSLSYIQIYCGSFIISDCYLNLHYYPCAEIYLKKCLDILSTDKTQCFINIKTYLKNSVLRKLLVSLYYQIYACVLDDDDDNTNKLHEAYQVLESIYENNSCSSESDEFHPFPHFQESYMQAKLLARKQDKSMMVHFTYQPQNEQFMPHKNELVKIIELIVMTGGLDECCIVALEKMAQQTQDQMPTEETKNPTSLLHHFEVLVLLAELLMKQSKSSPTKIIECLIQMAKLVPNSFIPFLLLGRFYEHQGSLERSLKCFLKAYQLNMYSPVVGASLSDIYKLRGYWEPNLKHLLNVVSMKNVCIKSKTWAYLRLGLFYLDQEDNSLKAVEYLQIALKSNLDNWTIWRALGDAYFSRGSFWAAEKVYERSIEVSSAVVDTLYCRVKLANICLLLGRHIDAIKHYRFCLEERSGNTCVLALKGIAETYISLANQHVNNYLDKNAIDCINEALNHLNKAILLCQKNVCLWKLVGDACSIVRDLNDSMVLINVDSCVNLLKNIRESSDESMLNKQETLALSTFAYEQALKFHPNHPSLLHDVAFSYYNQANILSTFDAETEILLKKSLNTIEKCLSFSASSSNRHLHWNLLGVLSIHPSNFNPECCENGPLAQDAFIKSIQYEKFNSVAWTNLGVLYIIMNDLSLANLAFQESQGRQPAYVESWVGQALVAELTGCVTQVMDLFRHSSSLGHHLESQIGYAQWICRTLTEMRRDSTVIANSHDRYCIEKMFGVHVAIDCLVRFVQRIPNDASALNMLSVLYERNANNLKAFYYAEAAYELKHENLDNFVMVCTNCARLSLKLGNVEKSIKYFSHLQERESSLDVETLCWMALTFYRDGQIEESYSLYTKSFSRTKNLETKTFILISMAVIAYKYQDIDAALTLIFQSYQEPLASITSVLALCQLGLCSPLEGNRSSILKASLDELCQCIRNIGMNLKKSAIYDDNFISLSIMTVVKLLKLQEGELSAQRFISRSIMEFPNRPGIWLIFSQFLLQNVNSLVPCTLKQNEVEAKVDTALMCAVKAFHIDRKIETDLKNHISLKYENRYGCSRFEILLQVASCYLACMNIKKCIQISVNIVHEYPHLLQSWSMLSDALNMSGSPYLSSDNLEHVDRIVSFLKQGG